jgi:DNA-binding NtrC family response regulator
LDTGEIAKQQLAQTLKKVVLLVEDHFDTRWATATYLRDGGLRVIEAIDSAEAKALAQVTGHIDLVFTDIYMPGPDDGYELSRWLATHYPKLPVLLTSGERENRSAHPKNSLREFVRKPYDLDRILETIRQMVGN